MSITPEEEVNTHATPLAESMAKFDKKLTAIGNMVNNLAMSLSETTQKNSEIGMHLAALLRTIHDGKPLNAETLSESSIVNMVDKLDAYLKTALERKFLTVGESVTENSILCLKQTDANGQELNRKLLMNVHEQTEGVKALFVGKRVSQMVTGSLAEGQPSTNLIVLEIYEPTEVLDEEIK